MLIVFEDFNGSEALLTEKYQEEWSDIESVLSAMPLHLKASDQTKKRGSPIFDPVGTNAYIKAGLTKKRWKTAQAIPDEFDFLGTDVDFARWGLLLEAQFSNYPFLLNNVIRSELFSKSKVTFDQEPVEVVVIVTKAHMFPASNSTLYFEQAVKQLRALSEHRVFAAPMRLEGLRAPVRKGTAAHWTVYDASRYSRTVLTQTKCSCDIVPGRAARNRCRITIHPRP